jgi:hypothetical protein
VKNPEAAQSAVFLPVFPLVFASSVFVPTQTMPDWLRAFADNQPITVTANALTHQGFSAFRAGSSTTVDGPTVRPVSVRVRRWVASRRCGRITASDGNRCP